MGLSACIRIVDKSDPIRLNRVVGAAKAAISPSSGFCVNELVKKNSLFEFEQFAQIAYRMFVPALLEYWVNCSQSYHMCW